MATLKDLKKAAAEALRKTTKTGFGKSAEDRLGELIARIEALAREDMTAARQRAMRLSAHGIYVQGNVGSYASKAEGEQAIKVIERLQRKVK